MSNLRAYTELLYPFEALHLVEYVTISLFVAVFLRTLVSNLRSPLRKFPGPPIAAWTNLWYLYQILRGTSHMVIKELHDLYGPVVRIGPNLLDLDTPALIRTIYSTDGNWKKTPFYHAGSASVAGKMIHNVFSETDQAEHARIKRPIASLYSLGGIILFQPHIDAAIIQFCNILEARFINTGKPFDLGQYISFFAWDLVGEITFSESFGYLDQGSDFNHVLRDANIALDYFAAVGCYPWLDRWIGKNPIAQLGPLGYRKIGSLVFQRLMNRVSGRDGRSFRTAIPDFLDKFLEAKNKQPGVVDDGKVVGYTMINMVAGADTTANLIQAALYFSLRNQEIYRRLEKEVLNAEFAKAEAPPSWSSARALPYLGAVLQEAGRFHPGVMMLLPRRVPPGGFALPSGAVVPPGTEVGVNPYVAGRNTDIFGPDANVFRPERWLLDEGCETEEDYATRLRDMNAGTLLFGAGSRVCMGRHLALLEAYKTVAALIRRYEIELVDPTREWTVRNSWFPRQKGFSVKMRKRD